MENQQEISEKKAQHRLYADASDKIQSHLDDNQLVLGPGSADTLSRMLNLWALQQQATQKKCLPISNEVVVANKFLNPDGHRKLTFQKHLERLAYIGILLKKEGSENEDGGYAIPLTEPAGNKLVYFLNPALCGVLEMA